VIVAAPTGGISSSGARRFRLKAISNGGTTYCLAIRLSIGSRVARCRSATKDEGEQIDCIGDIDYLVAVNVTG
jgi:hypothetical protein